MHDPKDEKTFTDKSDLFYKAAMTVFGFTVITASFYYPPLAIVSGITALIATILHFIDATHHYYLTYKIAEFFNLKTQSEYTKEQSIRNKSLLHETLSTLKNNSEPKENTMYFYVKNNNIKFYDTHHGIFNKPKKSVISNHRYQPYKPRTHFHLCA